MHRWRFRCLWIVLLLSLSVVVVLIILRLGPHLLWRIGEPWDLAHGVQPVPVSPLADTPVPDDFVRCHLGPVTFSVPASMVSTPPEFMGEGLLCGVRLRDGAREVFVGLPTDKQRVWEAFRRELGAD